jgi:hypothetical protein
VREHDSPCTMFYYLVYESRLDKATLSISKAPDLADTRHCANISRLNLTPMEFLLERGVWIMATIRLPW